jgi:hypothetical protein
VVAAGGVGDGGALLLDRAKLADLGDLAGEVALELAAQELLQGLGGVVDAGAGAGDGAVEEDLAADAALDLRAVEHPVQRAADQADEGLGEGGAVDVNHRLTIGLVLRRRCPDRRVRGPGAGQQVEEGVRRDGGDDGVAGELFAGLEGDAVDPGCR